MVIAAAASGARQASFSSFSSLKAWGSHRVLRCGHVKRDIATARRPAEHLPRRHDEVEAAGSDAPAGSSPSKPRRRRPRRGAVALPATASPPAERRPPRAVRGEHLARGGRLRRHRRPRPVQRQLDMLFPGSWLSETHRVPDGR